MLRAKVTHQPARFEVGPYVKTASPQIGKGLAGERGALVAVVDLRPVITAQDPFPQDEAHEVRMGLFWKDES